MGERFVNILVCFERYEVVRAPAYIRDGVMCKHMRRMSVGEKCGNSFYKYINGNCVYLTNIQNNQKQPETYKILYLHII